MIGMEIIMAPRNLDWLVTNAGMQQQQEKQRQNLLIWLNKIMGNITENTAVFAEDVT